MKIRKRYPKKPDVHEMHGSYPRICRFLDRYTDQITTEQLLSWWANNKGPLWGNLYHSKHRLWDPKTPSKIYVEMSGPFCNGAYLPWQYPYSNDRNEALSTSSYAAWRDIGEARQAVTGIYRDEDTCYCTFPPETPAQFVYGWIASYMDRFGPWHFQRLELLMRWVAGEHFPEIGSLCTPSAAILFPLEID